MITVRECQYDEVKKFRDLEGEYHYMGESHGAGDMIRLIFEEDGKWIALMTWAAACYRLKPRDLEIGWNRAMCAKRLKLVANNRRFTILNEKGARPNLGSQLLGMAIRELPAIWKRKWGYSPLLAETFCDIERTYPPPKAPRSGRLRLSGNLDYQESRFRAFGPQTGPCPSEARKHWLKRALARDAASARVRRLS